MKRHEKTKVRPVPQEEVVERRVEVNALTKDQVGGIMILGELASGSFPKIPDV
jgi:hypothetical protein